MTANEIITNLSLTSLVGQKISDLSVPDNVTTLLTLLNMAKNKVAEDTLLWLGGEEITQVDGTYTYTLTDMPIQIIDVYDDEFYERFRNSPDLMGYYQTAPDELKFNTTVADKVIKVNYYATPDDYIITDEVNVPHTLISALEFYVTHKAYEIYKTEAAIFSSSEYYKKYKGAVTEYMSKSDSSDVDTVKSSFIEKIHKRGIK